MVSTGSSEQQLTVTLLDYGAGNVRSVRNALKHLGCNIRDVNTPDDILNADRLLFPGVGAFPQAMQSLKRSGLMPALKQYLADTRRPFFGMCLGMQILFEDSTEVAYGSDKNHSGLSVIPGHVVRFPEETTKAPIPHIGWNSLTLADASQSDENSWAVDLLSGSKDEKYYFVHSYCALPTTANKQYVLSYTDYGGARFISSVRRGNVMATQFHPEKSSKAGLRLMYEFMRRTHPGYIIPASISSVRRTNGFTSTDTTSTELAKRVIACLDVRSNDSGDLVVTKGDSYDVRESSGTADGVRSVRNLGKPKELAQRYYEEGADEITFLNITSFRADPLADQPLIELLQQTSETVFVPLCIGGGIRDFTDSNGRIYSALDVASAYFRAGADKVSIGSDAVVAAEQYYAGGCVATGKSSIEQISYGYGAQAVVVSVDPRRVHVSSPDETTHACVKLPTGQYCWYQCTVKGGREGRDLDVVQLARAVEKLGAGELLVNSIDADGQKQGFDHLLLQQISSAVGIPVIASSGAGSAQHFVDVFQRCPTVNAALAAGIFHRREVAIDDVKQTLKQAGVPVRLDTTDIPSTLTADAQTD